MSKTWKLYVDGECVGLSEAIEFSNWRKLVMSDTKEKFEALPWDNCKPHNMASVFYRNNTIDVVTGAGVLLTKNIINNPKTWVIGHSATSYSFDWLEQIKNNVDAWIDTELKKLEEREKVKAGKPVPPSGYRLCSREEVASVPSGSAKILIDEEWYSVGDPILMDKMPMFEAVVESGNGIYCTSAPRKFVRCTAQDAVKLSRLGAYVEKAEDGCERIWCRIELAPVTTSLRGCVYRVDRYTVPEDFKLQPVMPTVKLPDGFTWVFRGNRISAVLNGTVVDVPIGKFDFDHLEEMVRLRQVTLDAYREIHDGET